MNDAARDIPLAVSQAVEEAILNSLRDLYLEPDVRRCLLDRATHGQVAGPYRAYRLKAWEAQDRWVVSLADEHVQPGGRVLVVGCGAGRMCIWLAEAGYRVVGVDIIPEFIEAARRIAQEMPPETRPEFFAVDGYRWPVGDGEFDCVAMMATFLSQCPTTSIRVRLLSEAYRILQQGGCILVEAVDRTHPGFQLDREVNLAAEGCAHTLRLQPLCGLPGVVIGPLHPFRSEATPATSVAWYFADPRELWRELESAGFRIIRLQTEQSQTDHLACVTAVAVKDNP